VSDRIRTGDRLDHNQELYQLSYAHHGLPNLPALHEPGFDRTIAPEHLRSLPSIRDRPSIPGRARGTDPITPKASNGLLP
jgi:hypothetical protein